VYGVNFDVPVDTVSQDPLGVVQSNIPGLVISAPEVMVGPVQDSSSSIPTWLIILGVVLLLANSGRRKG
jgi:hypothetical protein